LDQNCPTFIKQKEVHKSTPYSQVGSQGALNSNAPVLDKSDTRESTTYDDIMETTPQTPSEDDIEMDTTESIRTSKNTTISDRTLRSHNKEKTNPLAIPLKVKGKADKSKTVSRNQFKHSKEPKQHCKGTLKTQITTK